ncbi:Transcription factor [Pseudozyma hubeiensis]|nr:Transcription factor [Pseudozyma hubeiensis]
MFDKQARRSLAEINAILESPPSEHAEDSDPQQPQEDRQQTPEHPMMAFINLMLKDLNVESDPQASSRTSFDSASSSARSLASSRSAVARYLETACLTKIRDFCAILPDWSHLQSLLRHYLWHVDWKFLITAQDLLEDRMKDLWVRIAFPSQSSVHAAGSPSSSSAGLSLQPGDLSRLALLACVLGETVESMSPDAIAEVLPISRSGVVASGPVNVAADANPRVKALNLLTYHVAALIEECVRLDEMTIDLVQANISAFSLWSNQGLHGTGSTEFPRWTVTIRAAKACNLFEDPGNNSNLSQTELDHRRRLAWLVYGYDHAFAVGANTRPLIVESQFSVDQPSGAAPWAACGAPPDECLARLEVMGGKMAQLVSSTLCYGPPLHRKAMETDQKISDMLSQLDPSYKFYNPDLSFDSKDPFRARRRCWLQLTTAWQRGSLHRQFFSPNGRITNGELATSRHIATDSALRSIFGARQLRALQNRFSDRMGSAWWYQYFTEPCMTLATAALLLIRSQGRGVPGLADEANCWMTLMHFTRTIDECVEDLEASIRDKEACLPSLVHFAEGCVKLIRQLRSAVQKSFDAFVQSRPELGGLKTLDIDERIMALLHPRSQTRSPGSQKRGDSGDSSGGGGVGGASSGGSGSSIKSAQKHSSKPAVESSSRRGSAAARGKQAPTLRTPVATLAAPRDSAKSLESRMQSGNMNPALAAEIPAPPGTLSLSFPPSAMSFPDLGSVGPSAPAPTPLTAAISQHIAGGPVVAPHFGVPAYIPPGTLLSPAEPFALRDFYSYDTDAGIVGQRSASTRVGGAGDSGGLSDWIAGVHMDVG